MRHLRAGQVSQRPNKAINANALSAIIFPTLDTMKLLTGYYTKEEADDLQEYLEENGIAVYVEYEGSKGEGIKYSVFAALEAQYEDARQLMANPDHVVVIRINIDQYQAYVASPQGSSNARMAFLKGIGILWVVVAVLAALAALLILARA